MYESQPIIDVTPIEHSNDRHNPSARTTSQGGTYQQASRKNPSDHEPAGYSAPFPPFGATFVYGTPDTAAASKTGSSVVTGLAQIVVGTGLVMIGIPMLILPGPGLLSIAGGFALAANGARKLFS